MEKNCPLVIVGEGEYYMLRRTAALPTKQCETFKSVSINPFTLKRDFIDFTLPNGRQFYSSKGDPLGVKGLKDYLP